MILMSETNEEKIKRLEAEIKALEKELTGFVENAELVFNLTQENVKLKAEIERQQLIIQEVSSQTGYDKLKAEIKDLNKRLREKYDDCFRANEEINRLMREREQILEIVYSVPQPTALKNKIDKYLSEGEKNE